MKTGIVRIVCYFLIALIFLFGLLIFVYPLVNRAVINNNSEQTLETFRASRELEADYINDTVDYGSDKEIENDDNADDEDVKSNSSNKSSYKGLYHDMQRYNKKIYDEGQSGITDAWTFSQTEFSLWSYGINDDVIAELRIPKMDCDLPLYLGASEYNMARGAAQLGQTSMPIGGINTNCVIAGHRGASGGKFFLDIEMLEIGDKVYIDNLWQTLIYEVSEIKVIYPNQSDEIMIQKGRDMITLMTCHPYPTNAQRYVVYCERTNNDAVSQSSESATQEKTVTSIETTVEVTNGETNNKDKVDSSKSFIVFENVLYIVIPIALVVLSVVLFFINKKALKKRK